MYCPNCNTQNPDDATLCSGCGTTLEQESLAQTPTVNPGKGLGIAGMILGICALITGTVCYCTCGPYLVWLSPILAVVGLILSMKGKKKSKSVGMNNTMATIGLICNIIGLVLASIVLIALAFILITSIVASVASTPSYYG